MEEIQEHKCARIGMKVSLLVATLAIIVLLVLTISYVADWFRYSVADKLISLSATVLILAVFYTSAGFLGKAAGKNICRERHKLGASIFVGIGVTLGSLAVAALAAEVSIQLAKILEEGRLDGPGFVLVMTILGGVLPAILLGILYGVLVRWRLTKAGCL